MKTSSIPLAHTLVSLCKQYGIRQVVISPGSRNAPLILGFTGDPYFECFSLVDERSAAFFALGLSQQGGDPTALVCTSGSALLNYYPAVAEAYYSRIPLVVLSADRPPYKIDIGDGQTIRQEGVFGNHIGFQASLQQDLSHAPGAIRWDVGGGPPDPPELERMQAQRQEQNQALIHQALQTARTRNLPVHLNAPFEEPLYQTREVPAFSPGPGPSVPPPQTGSVPWEDLSGEWGQSAKKMVLIGTLPPGCLGAKVLQRLAEDPSVLVLTETTSNVHHPDFFPSIDSILAPLELSDRAGSLFGALRPDLLLTLGGMIVSKKIKQFLRTHPPARHWHVDPYQAYDTYYALTRHIQMDANAFLQAFLPRVGPGRLSYRRPWEGYRRRYGELRQAYLRQIPFSDFAAFAMILESVPGGTQVQLANSSTVRYAQLFDMAEGNPVFCNRGTSGIEGSTSTAVGASVNSQSPVLLVTGDLSFLYDTNGLWNPYLRPDFRIIVLNNQGGGIFRILPGRDDSPVFETYFETVQQVSLPSLCDFYGLEYRSADSRETLAPELEVFFNPSDKPRLLEVRTPRKENDSVLRGYFDFLTSALPENA